MTAINAWRFERLEAQRQRARAWSEIARHLPFVADDWPEALTADEVAFLHAYQGDRTDTDCREGIANYIEQCIEHDEFELARIRRRERVPSSLGRGETPETWLVERAVVNAQDCARVLAGVELGPYLRHWLAPYMLVEKPAQDRAYQEEIPDEFDSLTPMRLAAVIALLGRKYPRLRSAANRGEEWVKACGTGRRGWYYSELVEKACQARYRGVAQPSQGADMSVAGQLRAVGK